MKYINKDITTVEGPAIILHGVNCQGKMGSGVAKALYEKWPLIKERYLIYPVSNDNLGNIDIIRVEDGIWVVNCFTQVFYGYDGKKYASSEAISKCLNKVAMLAPHKSKVYAPKIGCGLGGLDWETEVQPILEEFEKYTGFEVTICDYKGIN